MGRDSKTSIGLLDGRTDGGTSLVNKAEGGAILQDRSRVGFRPYGGNFAILVIGNCTAGHLCRLHVLQMLGVRSSCVLLGRVVVKAVQA